MPLLSLLPTTAQMRQRQTVAAHSRAGLELSVCCVSLLFAVSQQQAQRGAAEDPFDVFRE